MTPYLHELVLGEKTDAFLKRFSINVAIFGFVLHLIACYLYQSDYISMSDMNGFFDSYLDALYTPFSIILAYEVYELIRAIPESFSNSIGKQFEVITLLVVRDIFKNLAEIEGTATNYIDSDVAFIAMEAFAFIVLFSTALYFKKLTAGNKAVLEQDEVVKKFVMQKKNLACSLALVYILVAIYSFSSWSFGVIDGEYNLSRTVFFLDFFTWLIVSDIIILLSSYKHITDFLQLARNTGFVLSTVVIRVGIGTPGYTGAALFILSALLATLVLRLSIHDWSNSSKEEE
tara:strand:- start:1087 stop:1950 length:864 start_codon:yes stop_codon:yes gene_type:complete